ncbi:MAG TPA: hypothetical protein DCY75_04100, partial [Clostridiales bacterium]|nr:hypothetical protein [Clostridiales bacterium]
MFGYIRPVQSELKVKDAELYKALYCGLCRVMKKEVSSVLPLSISYDYVLLAAVRAGLSGETFWAEHQICPYKPYRRKKMARPVKALSDTAITALILTK